MILLVMVLSFACVEILANDKLMHFEAGAAAGLMATALLYADETAKPGLDGVNTVLITVFTAGWAKEVADTFGTGTPEAADIFFTLAGSAVALTGMSIYTLYRTDHSNRYFSLGAGSLSLALIFHIFGENCCAD